MTNTATFDDTEISEVSGASLDAPMMSALLDESLNRELFASLISATSFDEPKGRELFAAFYASTLAESLPLAPQMRFAEQGQGTWLTPLLQGQAWRSSARPVYAGERSVETDPLNKATQDRVLLLARKYIAKEKFSDEERARLAIVTERVRKLLPAVTVQEFEALEQVLTSLRDVSDANIKLREKLQRARQKNA